MTDEELNEIAIKVAARLEGESVTRLIPADIGKWLREGAQGYVRQQVTQIYMMNTAILQETEIRPDGSLLIRLCDVNHAVFWTAHLKPVSE